MISFSFFYNSVNVKGYEGNKRESGKRTARKIAFFETRKVNMRLLIDGELKNLGF